jgi:hypothetical protein
MSEKRNTPPSSGNIYIPLALAVTALIYGSFLLSGHHPLEIITSMLREVAFHGGTFLPSRVNAILILVASLICVFYSLYEMKRLLASSHLGGEQ